MNPIDIANRAAPQGSDRWLLIMVLVAAGIAFWFMLRYFISYNRELVNGQMEFSKSIIMKHEAMEARLATIIERNTAAVDANSRILQVTQQMHNNPHGNN